MEKSRKIFYINVCFAVFVFVLTTAFFKEYVFKSSTLLITGFSSLIGAAIGFGLMILFKNKGIVIKVIILFILILFIYWYAENNKKNKEETIEELVDNNLFVGKWIAQEDTLVVKLEINKKDMKMLILPENKNLIYEYETQNKTINFFNDMEAETFTWNIIKLNLDSLVVLDKNEILRFKRDK